MQKNLLGKTLFIIAVLLIFTVGIVLGPFDNWGKSYETLKERGPLAAIQQNIHLGLDLKGGTHLILQVQVKDAVNAETDLMVERLKEALNKANVNYGEIFKPDPANHPERIEIKGISPDASTQLRTVTERFQEYDPSSGPENTYVLTMKPASVTKIETDAVTQAIETIRNRVDKLGVSEPVIQEHGLGQYQILVQLPGVDDPARVKEIMQSTAMLEIRQAIDGQGYPSEAEAIRAHGGMLPPGAVMLRGSSIGSRSEEPREEVYVVSRTSVVAGRDIRDARPGRKETGLPIVEFSLTNEGGRRFRTFTGAHVGDFLAIVLDNRVREVARINSEISDKGLIEGGFTEQSAKDLGMLLRSGALPASIRYLEERTVGPSLGADSIRQGVTAAIIGMALVMAFMLVYYRGAGINADLALVLNLIILLGFMGFVGAVLTLPGIAGVILTVGMGVDSNVLIFERIREELRNGKSPASAVEQGFSRAWVTIIDTHVTTIVSALILLLFGTGPVRGFAVTLIFGLLANLFTAVFVSRVIFDAGLRRKQRGEAISI